MPAINSSVIELSKPDYLPIIKNSTTSYGGSQMWFPKLNWYSEDYVLHTYGCGTIATADMFLYLALLDDGFNSSTTELALLGSNQVIYEHYLPYVRNIHEEYTKTLRFIAVLGPKIASAINSYSSNYGLNLEASWKWRLTYYDMYDIMEDMLERDIPVILSIGPNIPKLWGKKGISFFERKEIDYRDNTISLEETKAEAPKEAKPYYYKPASRDINGHYVTVTAIVKDDIANRIMLRISSWGKQYYIDYEEYRDYIENYSGTFTSSLVQVRKNKLLFY